MSEVCNDFVKFGIKRIIGWVIQWKTKSDARNKKIVRAYNGMLFQVS